MMTDGIIEARIEALENAYDMNMARYGYGCSPYDDLFDEEKPEEYLPEDYMELD